MSRFFRGVVLPVLVLLSFAAASWAEDGRRLVIGVEDRDWAGHYRWVQGELTGIDADLVRIVAQRLGISVEYKSLPWARALMMAEEGTIDGVLDLAPTRSRKKIFHFVETPISTESTVFWVRLGSSFTYKGRFDSSMRIGLLEGSDWSDRFTREGHPTVTRFDSYKAAFKSLEAGRIDAFGGHLAPTMEESYNLGFLGRIEPSSPTISNLPYYIAFSRKPGLEELAKQFSDALREFYSSPDYGRFLDSHGIVDKKQGFYPPPEVTP